MPESFEPWSADSLVGGHPCLDLVNTRGGPTKDRDLDRLTDYDVALAWAQGTGLITAGEATELARASETQQRAALTRLRRFRDSLYTVLTGMVEQRVPEPAPWKAVQDTLRKAHAKAILWPDGPRLQWLVPVKGAGLDTPRLRAALAAQDLLTGEEVTRIRSCERCSWLYIDRSRGKPRRWCSMAICGNRAKAERHYRRKKVFE